MGHSAGGRNLAVPEVPTGVKAFSGAAVLWSIVAIVGLTVGGDVALQVTGHDAGNLIGFVSGPLAAFILLIRLESNQTAIGEDVKAVRVQTDGALNTVLGVVAANAVNGNGNPADTQANTAAMQANTAAVRQAASDIAIEPVRPAGGGPDNAPPPAAPPDTTPGVEKSAY